MKQISKHPITRGAIAAFFLIFAVTICLCACSDSQPVKSAATVMEQILSAVTDTDVTVTVNYDEEKYKSNFDMLYSIDSGLVSDGAIAYAERGMSADEISLLIADSDKAAVEIEAALKSRIQRRRNDFTGYAPDEVRKIDASIVVKSGRYVALIICDDPSAVRSALLDALN